MGLRSFAVMVCLAVGVAPAQVDATGDEASIRQAAKEAATKGDLELCRYGQLALAKTEAPGWYALFRDKKRPENSRLKLALFQFARKTWRLEVKEEGARSSDCLQGKPAGALPVRGDVETIQLNDRDEFRPSWTWVTFFNGALVIKSEDGMRGGEGTTENWVR
jgi:hypothetical protein